MSKRAFTSAAHLRAHDNPLGLPRKGTPPNLRSRLPAKRRLAGPAVTLAVSSAKGGVGKSTVAANLAVSLARRSLRAGLLDLDLHGPSAPTLFGLSQAPALTEAGQLVPLTGHGVKTMSMGYLVAADQPVAWRGLLVARALEQLLHQVDWGGLDVLVLDLPPGTGDVPLSVAQQAELDGVVLVSTASRLALADAVRGKALWDKTGARVLGAVHNMASYTCGACGQAKSVFGEGAADRFAAEGLDVLAQVPLDARICEDGDGGRPAAVADPHGVGARVFAELADKILAMVKT